MNPRLIPLFAAVAVLMPIACASHSSPATQPAVVGETPPLTPPATEPFETTEQHNQRMAWWRAARFGMFIHWGVYSVPAGTYDGQQIKGIGEWIMNNASIPVAVYARYAAQFNPTGFDADQWVSIAKNAGMKYIIITAKHHDGFAMFHTKVDGFNIYDATPFKRDPLAELAVACQKQGIKLGFYYSQSQDWHHPGGFAIKHGGRKTEHWDPAQDGDFDQYLQNVALPQVRELLTNYGPVAVLWFDTPRQMTPQRGQPFIDLLHELQPQIIRNNRLIDGGKTGDTETPEQYVPPQGFPGRDWETCMTINDTWGYKSYDTNFKSVETLLRNLIDIASKGGNYLLNVGPTAQGVIPQPEVDRLEAIGKWLDVNGEAIYGTGPTIFGAEAGDLVPGKKDRHGRPLVNAKWEWRCTTSPGKIFIHIFKWPTAPFELPPVKSRIVNAYLLADAEQVLPFTQTDEKVLITLPPVPLDPIATVVCLEVQ
jgi:alpha-L-fucosidase